MPPRPDIVVSHVGSSQHSSSYSLDSTETNFLFHLVTEPAAFVPNDPGFYPDTADGLKKVLISSVQFSSFPWVMEALDVIEDVNSCLTPVRF